jgi:GT2 family glycosyltransferase
MTTRRGVSKVDVVVVSHNSEAHLRACVEPLVALDGVNVIVVDNASSDSSVARIEDLPLRVIESAENNGFAAGCNIGWHAGSSPYVLFLNPDARVGAAALDALVAVLQSRADAGIVAPRIIGEDGVTQYSLRRFPRLRSTYSQALFLHRVAPSADWADEAIRRLGAYEHPAAHDWVSGACMLVRRSLLEQLGGWDDGFFLYCEDIDLCRRTHDLGAEVRYEPAAVVRHIGGGSAPRAATLPVLAASRVRYARLHRSRAVAFAERLGIALEAATRVVGARGGRSMRIGHARSLVVALIGRAGSRPPLTGGASPLEGV